MWTPGNDKLIDNRFYLEKVLGQGGFGITFLAQDRSKVNGAKCVIKTLKKDIPDFDSQQSKFRQEALNLAKCSHPYVVAVQDVIFHDGIWGLVMDYVDGDTLYTVMRDRPQERLSEEVALGYIDQIGQALEFVHDRGLLHRDLKPLNIMVCRNTNKAILIDFGLARDFVFDDSRSMTAMMTEGFAPIEQYDRRGKFGPYTDVYALAATLYCVLVGEAPLFNAKGRKQASDGGKSIDNFMWEKLQEAGVSDRVQKAIIWGMQVMAGDRPQGMGEWREALGLVSRSVPQGVTFEPTRRYSGEAQRKPQYQEVLNQEEGRSKELGKRKGILIKKRCLAFLVDLIIIITIAGIIGNMAYNLTGRYVVVFAWVFLLTLLAYFTYYYHLSPNKATLGQIQFKIVVVDIDGNRARFWQMQILWRNLIMMLATFFWGFAVTACYYVLKGYEASVFEYFMYTGSGTLGLSDSVIALCRKDGRYLHDILSGTQVIERHS